MRKRINNTSLLIGLCWLVYTCSYLGKLGYSANIAQIEDVYNVSKSTVGMVSTFFFFAYGAGQILNGLFCKKYNIRLVIFISLVISGLMNLIVGVSQNFSVVKWLWLVNGAVLSVLWTSLVRLLSENLSEKDVGRAVVAMGTTVATGTFFVYGLSALFVAMGNYRIIFFVAGVLLPLIALLWIIAYPKLIKKKDNSNTEDVIQAEPEKKARLGWLWVLICALAVFAVINNLVKDGLTTWVPMILKETYLLPDYMSILLTMLLPVLAIFGTSVAVILHKKIKDFVMLSTTLFFTSALFIGLVILCLPTGWFAVTLGSFGIVSCLMAGINNIITSMAPLYWKGKVNSGLLAGVLNGFCYLGSTISAYGLGAVADRGGWNAVFWLLFGLCTLAVVLGVVCFIVNKARVKESI